MTIKSISTNIGKALLINAMFMFLAIVISVIEGFDSGFTPLAISFSVTFITGMFPFIFVKTRPSSSLQSGFMTIVLSWLLSFVFGMLPYVLWGGEFTLINAWFESVSGYTTTGSTILTNIEALPKSILFWRSSTHFIGGLGVIIFLLMILPDSSAVKLRLTHLELSSLSKEGYRFRSGTTARVMVGVYRVLAICEFLLLWAAGMSSFDAINHALSTVSTGGFSTRNMSIMHYDSVTIDIIITVFMILSSMHFGVLFAIAAKRSLKPLRILSMCNRHHQRHHYVISQAARGIRVLGKSLAGLYIPDRKLYVHDRIRPGRQRSVATSCEHSPPFRSISLWLLRLYYGRYQGRQGVYLDQSNIRGIPKEIASKLYVQDKNKR